MQIFTKLQKFNTVAFTLLSVLLIFLILLFISQHANEWIEKNEYDRSLFDGVASDRYIGNVTSSSAGPITYYHRAGEGDAKLDVRFIDMRDGRVLNISKDPAQPIYRLEIL